MDIESLTTLWNRQTQLILDFGPVESSTLPGLEWGHIPVSFTSYAGQARLKYTAWCIVEELGEVSRADTLAQIHEEMIDCLHFMVELLVCSGVKVQQVAAWVQTAPPPGPFPLQERLFINLLSAAMHELKMRPWKKSPAPTYINPYQNLLVMAFWDLIGLCHKRGMTDRMIINAYIEKNEVNHQRIERGA